MSKPIMKKMMEVYRTGEDNLSSEQGLLQTSAGDASHLEGAYNEVYQMFDIHGLELAVESYGHDSSGDFISLSKVKSSEIMKDAIKDMKIFLQIDGLKKECTIISTNFTAESYKVYIDAFPAGTEELVDASISAYILNQNIATHIEGFKNISTGQFNHLEGAFNLAYSNQAHIEGHGNISVMGLYFGSVTSINGNTITIESRTELFREYPPLNLIKPGDGLIAIVSNMRREGGDSYSFKKNIDYSIPVYLIVESVDMEAKTITIANPIDISTLELRDIFSLEKDYSNINSSHVEGISNVSCGVNNHVEGKNSVAFGMHNHVEGESNISFGDNAHAEGLSSVAIGIASHVEGAHNASYGEFSHAEGTSTKAYGRASHVEGDTNIAYGNSSHVEGDFSVTLGPSAHAEGFSIAASYSHAEGNGTYAVSFIDIPTESVTIDNEKCMLTFAEDYDVSGIPEYIVGMPSDGSWYGVERIASRVDRVMILGCNSAQMGNYVKYCYADVNASGMHSEGTDTRAFNRNAHAEGFETIAKGQNSHAEGFKTYTEGENSHTEGYANIITNGAVHRITNPSTDNHSVMIANTSNIDIDSFVTIVNIISPGGNSRFINSKYKVVSKTEDTIVLDTTDDLKDAKLLIDSTNNRSESTHAEGSINIVSGDSAHAEGASNIVSNAGAHAEGIWNTALGRASHVEGYRSEASGDFSHAENYWTTALGENSHAEGMITHANGMASHAEGNDTRAIGHHSHSEGSTCVANGEASHVEGTNSTANGDFSHAEGTSTSEGNTSHAENNSMAIGDKSHSEGDSVSSGHYSHAEGRRTVAMLFGSHTEGKNTLTAFGALYKVVSIENATITVEEDLFTLQPESKAVLFSTNGDSMPFVSKVISAENKIVVIENNAATQDYNRLVITRGEQTYEFPSHAEGRSCAAFEAAHAEGDGTIAKGAASHSEGSGTHAEGSSSHSEGFETTAAGEASHAEGYNNLAKGTYSHAEGYKNNVDEVNAHIEGSINTSTYAPVYCLVIKSISGKVYTFDADEDLSQVAIGDVYTHWYGNGENLTRNTAPTSNKTVVTAVDDVAKTITVTRVTPPSTTSLGTAFNSSIVINGKNIGKTVHLGYGNSHIEGINNINKNINSHLEGTLNENNGIGSHLEGQGNIVTNNTFFTHVEGISNKVLSGKLVGNVLSKDNTAKTITFDVVSSDLQAFPTVNLFSSRATAVGSFNRLFVVENVPVTNITGTTITLNTTESLTDVNYVSMLPVVPSYAGHVEGLYNTILSSNSHAEGNSNLASNTSSHAEGTNTKAIGNSSHTEGQGTIASNDASHAEGSNTKSSGQFSHAEGQGTIASGTESHSGNTGTIAQGLSQTVIGRYNIAQGTGLGFVATDYAFIIGNGVDTNNRSNAFAVKWNGEIIASNIISNGISLNDSIDYSVFKIDKDANKIFTTIQHKRKDSTLISTNVLSGGTSPRYTTRTITNYAQDGTTVISTKVYTLAYDSDGDIVSEVLQ